ncbi:MAG TPA: 2-amino-4-hydroxy-6-hydroxymethyldihydropteridine diphosphokinase [Bryobacteraceae bacterium]|jgi:2-amino-4-hydroxy-6-hydroxymethyldihydropteridine diphosphokinase|nr:2-amino-4-hydroxy-6-hydroxymethyldihydropteridine diphosphokinase [Bryobacteraceae bacterium]
MTCYLSLGSNLGDRERNLAEAIRRLDEAAVTIATRSSIYETEPQDIYDQPWFLNLVVEASTSLEPEALLRTVLETEASMGRVRVRDKGPRLIDIDILLLGETIIDSAALQLPHPRMIHRRFVLAPLVEIAPDLRDPRTGELFRDLLASIEGQAARKRSG